MGSLRPCPWLLPFLFHDGIINTPNIEHSTTTTTASQSTISVALLRIPEWGIRMRCDLLDSCARTFGRTSSQLARVAKCGIVTLRDVSPPTDTSPTWVFDLEKSGPRVRLLYFIGLLAYQSHFLSAGSTTTTFVDKFRHDEDGAAKGALLLLRFAEASLSFSHPRLFAEERVLQC